MKADAQSVRLHDYDAIQAAVLETERGRWFLAEFARRNRHAETKDVLDALAPMQQAITDSTGQGSREAQDALSHIARQISALRPRWASSLTSRVLAILDDHVDVTAAAVTMIQGSVAEMRNHIAAARQRSTPASAGWDELDAAVEKIERACTFQGGIEERTRVAAGLLKEIEKGLAAIDTTCLPALPLPAEVESPPTFLIDDDDIEHCSPVAGGAASPFLRDEAREQRRIDVPT